MMTPRLLLALLTLPLAAQTAPNSLFGTKASDLPPAGPVAQGVPPAAPAAGINAAPPDTSVVITPFRLLTLPEPKVSRTFQLSKLNRIGSFETTKELQRLYTAFAGQRIVDGSPAGSSKATGYLTTVNYALLQDLGDQRFLAKAAWPAAGPNDALAAGVDTMAVLLLDRPAKVGDTGKLTGMHVGMVAVLLTAEFPPLAGRRLTLRREAFVECATLEDSPAGLQRFAEAIAAGADLNVLTHEQASCKACGGLGFTREPQKGQLLDKRVPCAECASTGKVTVAVETKFVP